MLANLQVGNERSCRESASPVLPKISDGYDIVLTLPDTELHKTVAIKAGDDVDDLFRRVEEKMGSSSPPGNWQLELRFQDLSNKGKGGYLVDRTDHDTWRTFNNIVRKGDETEVIGIFHLQK